MIITLALEMVIRVTKTNNKIILILIITMTIKSVIWMTNINIKIVSILTIANYSDNGDNKNDLNGNKEYIDDAAGMTTMKVIMKWKVFDNDQIMSILMITRSNDLDNHALIKHWSWMSEAVWRW